MKPSQKPDALPLEYAAEIAFEIHLLRGECSQTALDVMRQRPLDETALDDCARLDDALAQAHALLQATIARIKGLRSKRPPGSR